MADEILVNENEKASGIATGLYGRLPIWTSIERFDPEKTDAVLAEVNSALTIHGENVVAEDFLYWYRRGMTPVLGRTKEIRPEINNKVNVALAESVVSFHNGYFMTKPAFYVSRTAESGIDDDVKLLNDYLYRSGKHKADNKVIDWFHTVGKGDIFIRSNDDPKKPFVVDALDPRNAFVARSSSPDGKVVYGGYTVKQGDNLLISVWDDTNVYTLEGAKTQKTATPEKESLFTATRVVDVRPNPLGAVPIVEYYYNSVMMGAFEQALPLLDAISYLQSDRLDGVDQAVQSLLVFYNCELDDDDEENPTTPQMIRKAGALFLKSVGENKADLKEIVTNLDQTQTQVFIDNLYEQVLTICAMPFTAGARGYSNASTGQAQLARDGWFSCDCVCRNSEDLFLESNEQFDEIMLKILRTKGILDIDPADIKLQIPRNETANVQSKAQAFNTLVASGFEPTLAAAKSGISNDPVADIQKSEPYLRMIWGDPNKVDEVEEQTNGQGEAVIVERSVSENETEGDI